MYLLEKTTRAIAFAAGDLRLQPGFPWFATGHKEYKISIGEALEAVATARFGDVGLHRTVGYFSNLAIPGAMKHAWIHTHDVEDSKGRNGGLIVEAASDGVQSKHALLPYITDYAVLLRPKGVTEDERKGACIKASDIVGAEYDTNFVFDIEKQLQFYNIDNEDDKLEAVASLRASEAALQK